LQKINSVFENVSSYLLKIRVRLTKKIDKSSQRKFY